MIKYISLNILNAVNYAFLRSFMNLGVKKGLVTFYFFGFREFSDCKLINMYCYLTKICR